MCRDLPQLEAHASSVWGWQWCRSASWQQTGAVRDFRGGVWPCSTPHMMLDSAAYSCANTNSCPIFILLNFGARTENHFFVCEDIKF